mmetsp:Transcript_28821/g.73036  ORF Transcript_28821/g.73036 Transcript_28821/m.73036 type:complete len:813 (+) Transcript_28821:769-3207(+)
MPGDETKIGRDVADAVDGAHPVLVEEIVHLRMPLQGLVHGLVLLRLGPEHVLERAGLVDQQPRGPVNHGLHVLHEPLVLAHGLVPRARAPRERQEVRPRSREVPEDRVAIGDAQEHHAIHRQLGHREDRRGRHRGDAWADERRAAEPLPDEGLALRLALAAHALSVLLVAGREDVGRVVQGHHRRDGAGVLAEEHARRAAADVPDPALLVGPAGHGVARVREDRDGVHGVGPRPAAAVQDELRLEHVGAGEAGAELAARHHAVLLRHAREDHLLPLVLPRRSPLLVRRRQAVILDLVLVLQLFLVRRSRILPVRLLELLRLRPHVLDLLLLTDAADLLHVPRVAGVLKAARHEPAHQEAPPGLQAMASRGQRAAVRRLLWRLRQAQHAARGAPLEARLLSHGPVADRGRLVATQSPMMTLRVEESKLVEKAGAVLALGQAPVARDAGRNGRAAARLLVRLAALLLGLRRDHGLGEGERAGALAPAAAAVLLARHEAALVHAIILVVALPVLRDRVLEQRLAARDLAARRRLAARVGDSGAPALLEGGADGFAVVRARQRPHLAAQLRRRGHRDVHDGPLRDCWHHVVDAEGEGADELRVVRRVGAALQLRHHLGAGAAQRRLHERLVQALAHLGDDVDDGRHDADASRQREALLDRALEREAPVVLLQLRQIDAVDGERDRDARDGLLQVMDLGLGDDVPDGGRLELAIAALLAVAALAPDDGVRHDLRPLAHVPVQDVLRAVGRRLDRDAALPLPGFAVGEPLRVDRHLLAGDLVEEGRHLCAPRGRLDGLADGDGVLPARPELDGLHVAA